MKVLYVASEATPFVKVGGLSDVAGSLPAALNEQGIDARVIIPKYSAISTDLLKNAEYIDQTFVKVGWRDQYCGVFECKYNDVIYYLIDNEFYFKRDRIYGDYDDGERFAFFSRAVLAVLPIIDFKPDILHCNDWHTALIPVVLDTQYRENDFYKDIKTVFTIHNIQFQGQYDPRILGDVFGLDKKDLSLVYYKDCINLVKGAIECSNRVTTVSKTYANEILNPYFSYGLDDILRRRSYKLSGIVNGIDTDFFNPQTDKYIKTNYSYKTIQNKRFNKLALQKEMGLKEDKDIPMITMVTRLTAQKGLDLVKRVMPEIVAKDVQFIILGTGDREYEDFFHFAEFAHHDKVRGVIMFDKALAQRIYAGADFLLMPSKFEPCGLSQLIAMRYGTIPIVNKIGGLADTVVPYNIENKSGWGITFESYDAYDMLGAINRALDIYYDKTELKNARKNAMDVDSSFTASAKEYIDLYNNL